MLSTNRSIVNLGRAELTRRRDRWKIGPVGRTIRIRPLRTPAEYDACVGIQRRVWSRADLEITPPHQLQVSVYMGGILLGAFVDGEAAGYVYSYPAVFGGRTIQHSHHLAVLPEFRGLGLGKTLKWAQRDEALARGYNLITWTFDPLQARNANLNLHALGAIGRTYLDDFYGPAPSLILEDGVPTDRLLVEWPLMAKRVCDRAAGVTSKLDPEMLPKAVVRKAEESFPRASPRRPDFSRREKTLLVEIPRAIRELKGLGGLIGTWQKAVRAAFVHYFKTGYVLTDFISGERAYYVLRRSSGSPR
jgi:chorismate synthase